jgi:hypothetical protein
VLDDDVNHGPSYQDATQDEEEEEDMTSHDRTVSSEISSSLGASLDTAFSSANDVPVSPDTLVEEIELEVESTSIVDDGVDVDQNSQRDIARQADSPDSFTLLEKYRSLPVNVKKNSAYFLLSYCKSGSEDAVPIVNEAIIGDYCSEAWRDVVVNLAVLLHCTVFQPASKTTKAPKIKDINDIVHWMIHENDVMKNFLVALCTGQAKLREDFPVHISFQVSKLLGCFVAHQTIVRAITPYVDYSRGLQTFLSRVFDSERVSAAAWDLMCKMLMVISRKRLFRKLGQAIQGNIDFSAIFGKFWFRLLRYDNIGFKKIKGYVQYIIVMWSVISLQQMIDDGVYTHSTAMKTSTLNSPDKYLAELQDYIDYHFPRMHIHMLKVMRHLPEIPTVHELRNMVPQLQFGQDRPITVPLRVLSSTEDANDAIQTIMDLEVAPDDVEVEEVEQDSHESFLEANNITMDKVIQKDLNTKEAVIELCKHLEEVDKSCNENGKCDEVDQALVQQHGITQTVHEYGGCFSVADGNPTFQILQLQKQNGQFPNINAEVGGFHLYLESFKVMGKLFRITVLEGIFVRWRPTKPQLDWVFEPSDPNQIQHEMEEVLLAFYCSAAREYEKIHRTSTFSVQDLSNFIRERASRYACVFDLLLTMQYTELVFNLRDAESEPDDDYALELFLATERMLMPFFCSANATKYIKLGIHEREKWDTRSDFLRKIVALYVLRAKTKNGAKQYADKLMERAIMIVRDAEGKVYTAGTASSILRTAANLTDKANMKLKLMLDGMRAKVMARSHSKSRENLTSKTVAISNVFKHAMEYFDDHQVWGPGPPLTKSKKVVKVDQSLGGDTYNAEHLQLISTGEKRYKAYIADRRFNAQTNENEHHLFKVAPPLLKEVRKEQMEEYKDSISLDKDHLLQSKLYLKHHMVAEIMRFVNNSYGIPVPTNQKSLERKTNAALLDEYVLPLRRRYFLEQPQPSSPVLRPPSITIDRQFLSSLLAQRTSFQAPSRSSIPEDTLPFMTNPINVAREEVFIDSTPSCVRYMKENVNNGDNAEQLMINSFR